MKDRLLRRRATTPNLSLKAGTRARAKASISLRFSFSLHRSPIIVPLSSDFISPVPHLLNSNLPPSDAERILVQDAVDIVSAQNDAIINTMKKHRVDPAVSKRLEEGEEFVRAHKNVLSSIRLLPPEILAEIFCIYCESFLLHAHPHIITLARNGVIYPWTVSQVSRLWRSTALSLHHLWGQLIVDTCLWKSNQPTKSFLALFATLVDRSQEAPLCVYFCTPRNVQVEDLQPMIDVLVAHSDRWETVYLVSTYSVINAFQGIRGRMASLRRLYLSFSGEDPSINEPITMFEVAPRLTSLYLGTSYFSGKILLPWSQFTVFLDGGDSSNGFAREKIIPSSESLIDLQLTRLPIHDLLKQWPTIRLDNLRSLAINFNNLEEDELQNMVYSDNLLRNLTISSIEEISITNYPGNILPPLTSLLYRSLHCSSLQELSLSTYYLGEFQPGELSSFFELIPYLKKLSIYLPSALDLHRLVLHPESTPQQVLLPNLEELYIFIYDSIAGYEEVLAQLAMSRCEERKALPFSPITTVSGTATVASTIEVEVNSDSDSDDNESGPLSPTTITSTTRMFESVARLQHFRLIFPGAVLCHSGHEALECYHSATSLEIPPSVMERICILKDWTALANSFLSIFAYFWAPTAAKAWMKSIRRAFQVSQFFGTIESVKVENSQELYLSDIHHLMYHISNLSSSEVPGDNMYHIRKRARALLDQWSPMLKDDLPNRKWSFQGGHSIVYVPSDSPFRSSPEQLKSMIYGDKFYPQKYSVSWYDLQVNLQFLD